MWLIVGIGGLKNVWLLFTGSPRATGSSNYRKNFAHGVKSNLSVGSSYSDDSHPHKNKMYFSPITR